ncbi:hypothetical protein NIES4071_04400 [Calothrix sp. NIES-4071]|nr:hypothetical protein NIES4071_04400 [Calothrix sp. NIES-4071]BAZ54786.1 hypothetical protein NIES4105_04390 [Calothrix sp. NIES-4105]
MVRKSIAWLIPLAITVLGADVRAQAQTTNNFEIEYKTVTQIFEFQQPDIVRAVITGTSTSPAPFGLDSFISNTYGRRDTSNPPLIKISFNSEPTALGLPSSLESFSDSYFGGPNTLSGKANDSAEINPVAGTIQGGGTITIFDGTGIFENATGKVTFTQQDTFDPSAPPGPVPGAAILKFAIQTPVQKVPEYTPTYTLVSASLIGAVLFKGRKRQKANSLL